MSFRFCVILICMSATACSNNIQNSFTILGCQEQRNHLMPASGITRCGDFYLVSEYCSMMQQYNVATDVFSNITLSGLREGARLKGVTTFRNMLYAIDQTNSVIYRIDTTGSVQAALNLPSLHHTNRHPIEGIAINSTNELVFVVQSNRTLLGVARVYTYKMKFTADGNFTGLELMPGNEIQIRRKLWQIPAKRRSHYTDIAYDAELTRLVLFRMRNGKHTIEEMEVNQQTGILIPESLRKVTDVNRQVRACNRYSTHVEGITTDGLNYYLVSGGDPACESTTKDPPLFICIFVQEGPIFLKENPSAKPGECQ